MKIAKRMVRRLAGSLSVKHAASATTATHASSADTATNATHASSADTATNATHAISADTATNATHASSADTATNAQQLGGQSASAYEHGGGRVITAQLSNVGAAYQVLFENSAIQVLVSVLPNLTGDNVQIKNETTSELTYTQNGATPGSGTIAANGGTSTGAFFQLSGQITLQVWNAATPSNVWTITLSGLPSGTIAGEMTIGSV
jgi:hypothetical protein